MALHASQWFIVGNVAVFSAEQGLFVQGIAFFIAFCLSCLIIVNGK